MSYMYYNPLCWYLGCLPMLYIYIQPDSEVMKSGCFPWVVKRPERKFAERASLQWRRGRSITKMTVDLQLIPQPRASCLDNMVPLKMHLDPRNSEYRAYTLITLVLRTEDAHRTVVTFIYSRVTVLQPPQDAKTVTLFPTSGSVWMESRDPGQTKVTAPHNLGSLRLLKSTCIRI